MTLSTASGEAALVATGLSTLDTDGEFPLNVPVGPTISCTEGCCFELFASLSDSDSDLGGSESESSSTADSESRSEASRPT